MPSAFDKETIRPMTLEMSPRQAASRLDIRLDGLYSLIWSGRLAAQKVDGRWRISAAAVEKWLRARRRRASR
jgi:excisionase family DNA binding protein